MCSWLIGCREHLLSRLVPLACSLCALSLMFWGAWQCDRPLIWFLRTVRNQDLEWWGNIGNLLGEGWVLVGISAGLLILGVVFKAPRLRGAGLRSIFAHGLAGLVAQILKHVVGRPRPRFMHGDDFQWGPSFMSGLDSIPSGHTSASFAVATVVAKYFPSGAWPAYAVGGVVAASRVIRGSHFPTDVLLGTIVGVLSGLVIVAEPGQRGEALKQGILRLAPGTGIAFALFWMGMNSWNSDVVGTMALWIGSVLTLSGVGLRLGSRLGTFEKDSWFSGVSEGTGLVMVGVGLTTGSLVVSAIGVFIGLSHVAENRNVLKKNMPNTGDRWSSSDKTRVYIQEIGQVGLAGSTIVALQMAQGLLPLL